MHVEVMSGTYAIVACNALTYPTTSLSFTKIVRSGIEIAHDDCWVIAEGRASGHRAFGL